jgi:hypothetical protein
MFSHISVFSLLIFYAIAQQPPAEPPDYSGDKVPPYPSLTAPTTAIYPTQRGGKLASLPTDEKGNPFIIEYTIDDDESPDFNLTGVTTYSAQYKLPQCGDKISSNTGDSILSFTLDTYDSDDDYEPEQLAQRHAWLANGYMMSISNTNLRILPLGGIL